MDFHKLPETTAVVVPDSFCVSESLQQGVSCREERGESHKTKREKELKRRTECYLPLSSHLYPGLFHTRLLSTWKTKRVIILGYRNQFSKSPTSYCLLLKLFAFKNALKTILKTHFTTENWGKAAERGIKRQIDAEILVAHLSTNLVFSVLPAPDSPETMMDWLIFRTFMSLYALSAETAHRRIRLLDYCSLPQRHKPDPNNQADIERRTLITAKVPGRTWAQLEDKSKRTRKKNKRGVTFNIYASKKDFFNIFFCLQLTKKKIKIKGTPIQFNVTSSQSHFCVIKLSN